MGLIRGKGWWWRFFKELLFDLHTVMRGHITLSYGRHEIQIPIDSQIKPYGVYLNCQDIGIPVCAGDVSMASAKLNEEGNYFTLYADIKSNTCNVLWLIEYDPDISPNAI